jgi:uncharacterized protein (TIGR02598 family)
MKPNRFKSGRERRCGFSLVEAVIAIGVMSFGFLALAPLLVLGVNLTRAARANEAASQLATTLVEQAKQGTVSSGLLYFDSAGQPCATGQGAYSVLATVQTIPATGNLTPLSRLTLRVTPLGAPGEARTYADVFPTPP